MSHDEKTCPICSKSDCIADFCNEYWDELRRNEGMRAGLDPDETKDAAREEEGEDEEPDFDDDDE